MDEFGETPSIYVYPQDHEPGDLYPSDFWVRLTTALDQAGIDWERT